MAAFQAFRADACGRGPGGEAVEHRPQPVDVADPLRVQRRDLQTSPPALPDQALVPQQQQCLLDRLAGHLEPLRQQFLTERRAGHQLSGADLLDNRVVDLLDARGRSRKGCHDSG